MADEVVSQEQEQQQQEQQPQSQEAQAAGVEEAPAPTPKARPIESRFLFVDVAAMRAKQLRRGARPRLSELDEGHDPSRPLPHKPERIAMEEVRRKLIPWELPNFKNAEA